MPRIIRKIKQHNRHTQQPRGLTLADRLKDVSHKQVKVAMAYLEEFNVCSKARGLRSDTPASYVFNFGRASKLVPGAARTGVRTVLICFEDFLDGFVDYSNRDDAKKTCCVGYLSRDTSNLLIGLLSKHYKSMPKPAPRGANLRKGAHIQIGRNKDAEQPSLTTCTAKPICASSPPRPDAMVGLQWEQNKQLPSHHLKSGAVQLAAAGHTPEALSVLKFVAEPLQFQTSNCRTTHPLQNMPRHIKSVLWEGYHNYDMSAAHMRAALPTEVQLPDYTQLAADHGLSRDAVKEFFNRSISMAAPKRSNWDSWTNRYGFEAFDKMSEAFKPYRQHARPAAELMSHVRDTIDRLITNCLQAGINVLMHEHDGIITDDIIPEELWTAAKLHTGMNAHAELREKSFI